MSNVVQFINRTDKAGELREQIAQFNRNIDEAISASGDAALCEVHSTLSSEISAGRVSPHYAGLLDKLRVEITRRGLNVVTLRSSDCAA